MKLKNRITGEIIDLDIADIKAQFGGISVIPEPAVLGSPEYVYPSLADLSAEWVDYNEPKKHYEILGIGVVMERKDVEDEIFRNQEQREIGNYFETKEEAEKVVEKLKAWKRLKDKGFRFDGYDVAHKSNGNLAGQIFYDAGKYSIEDVEKEMNLLFGGEE